MQTFFGVTFGLSILIPIAFGASSVRAADTFAMGLGNLSWGMSAEEATHAYPTLGPWLPPYRHVLADPAAVAVLEMPAYSYAGCDFAVRLEFYQNRLNSIWIDHEGDFRNCAPSLEREFVTAYGAPVEAQLSLDMEWLHPYGSQYAFGYEDGWLHWSNDSSEIDVTECHRCRIGNDPGGHYAPDLQIVFRARSGQFIDKERY